MIHKYPLLSLFPPSLPSNQLSHSLHPLPQQTPNYLLSLLHLRKKVEKEEKNNEDRAHCFRYRHCCFRYRHCCCDLSSCSDKLGILLICFPSGWHPVQQHPLSDCLFLEGYIEFPPKTFFPSIFPFSSRFSSFFRLRRLCNCLLFILLLK